MGFYPWMREKLDIHSKDMVKERARAFKSDSNNVKSEFHQNVTLSLASLISKCCILAHALKIG